MEKPLDALMQKEMSRKEFVATVAFGVASLTGFSTIIHLLTGKSLGRHGLRSSYSYGGGAYGGKKGNSKS